MPVAVKWHPNRLSSMKRWRLSLTALLIWRLSRPFASHSLSQCPLWLLPRDDAVPTGRALHGGDAQTVDHMRKRLGKAWLQWSLLDWCDELHAPLGDVDLCSDAGLDAVLLDQHEKLLAGFVFKWGTEHAKRCRQPDSCVAYILDGHFKCRRIVCAWTRARLERVTGLKSELVLGCLKRPQRGSRSIRGATCRRRRRTMAATRVQWWPRRGLLRTGSCRRWPALSKLFGWRLPTSEPRVRSAPRPLRRR